MVTEEERKNFLTLRRVLLANSVREQEWSASDLEGQELDLENVLTTEIRNWRGYNNIEIIDIPEECVESLKSWYNREISPRFEDAQIQLHNQIPDDPGYEEQKIVFDCIGKEIYFEIIVSYTAEADETGTSWGEDERVIQLCENFSKEHPECSELSIHYYGGGDSGDIDYVMCDGEQLSMGELPSEIEDFIYNNLPGGWEINEGSRGTFNFDLVEKEASLVHVEYYEASRDTVVHKDKF